jgi:hypothetical protein
MNVRSHPLLATFIAVCLTPFARAQIKATPLTSHSPEQQFPRISGLAPKTLHDQVNALLAKRESQDLDKRKECLASGMPNAPASTYETIRTAYLSPYLLSIDVRVSWTGCTSYPVIDMTEPLTIDLQKGAALNWHAFFIGGFFESTDDKGSPITQLYLHHAELTPECNAIVNKPLTEYILWLDSQTGLMIRPALPHATQACSKLVSVPFSEIKEQVNPTLRRDLPASMRRASPSSQLP